MLKDITDPGVMVNIDKTDCSGYTVIIKFTGRGIESSVFFFFLLSMYFSKFIIFEILETFLENKNVSK